MSITGGVKFFTNNKALYRDGNTIIASSGNSVAPFVLDVSKYTRWESIGTTDLNTETLTITFLQPRTIDRLMLIGHNFKSYGITYNGGTAFTNVSNLDGALGGGIVETVYDKNTSYYEFASVTVNTIEISVTTTQVADAEKYLTQFMVAEELGTLAGFPRVESVRHDRNIRVAKALSGRNIPIKGYETTSFKLTFKSYPVQADIDLAETLHLREESFLVWLCGGRYGTEYFNVEQRGWRLEDIYNMQHVSAHAADYEKGIYQNGVNTSLNLVEVV